MSASVSKAPAAGLCSGKGQLITPGNCETSLLYQKLTATPPCGTQMPLGQPPLSPAALMSLCQWIMAGAKP